MRQLLQNVIGNSLKYRRHGVEPLVNVSAKLPADNAPARDGQPRLCQITVTDNGIGFDAEYAERIFGIFQRLHGRTEYEGTGVGLAICRKIAERHGGSIEAEGRVDEGATFVITLPVTHAPILSRHIEIEQDQPGQELFSEV